MSTNPCLSGSKLVGKGGGGIFLEHTELKGCPGFVFLHFSLMYGLKCYLCCIGYLWILKFLEFRILLKQIPLFNLTGEKTSKKHEMPQMKKEQQGPWLLNTLIASGSEGNKS